jgi:hypothetical protein
VKLSKQFSEVGVAAGSRAALGRRIVMNKQESISGWHWQALRFATGSARAAQTTIAPLLALTLTIALAGCRNKNNSDTTGVSRSVGAAPSAAPLPTDALKLATGPATLNYLLGSGGQIHVVDLDTGKTIATANAPMQAVITVNQSKGVVVANKVIKAGPLPTGHRYEIWLDHK